MERTPMEKALSTDVVMDIIMGHLKVSDLLACRQVSKFWNKAASSVLGRRSTMIKYNNMHTLMEIGKRMKNNPDFPYSGLEFVEPWKMTTAGAIKFVQNFGERFTSLRLYTHLNMRVQDMAPFISHLPRLSILELYLSSQSPPRCKVLDPANSKILDLSSVRTIRISPSSPGQKEGVDEANKKVLHQVFKAASSSELRIECLYATYTILSALENAGKLQAVSVLNVSKVKKQNDVVLRVDEWLSTQTPALTKLDWNFGGCISREGLLKLLISSQKTLKYLRLDGISPSQFSSECPVLAKLSTLSLRIRQSSKYVFKGRQGHKFPALKELKIDTWFFEEGILYRPMTANMSDGLFIVPSLKAIELYGYFDKARIEDLARCFPNVIGVRLSHWVYNRSSRYRHPTEIWSVGAFKFLEKLRIWDCTVQCPTEELKYSDDSIKFKKFKGTNMDSFLTGIPIGICENLRQHPQQNLMGSPLNEILRDSPNLLQLKNLRELVVCVSLTNELDELPEEPPFISMVSVCYALRMMSNLQAKFVYEDRWVKMYMKQTVRDKAVTLLKAAFKHVQPHVELEPFFY